MTRIFFFVFIVISNGLLAARSSDTSAVPGLKTLQFLYEISGHKTVAGIHNREPNLLPARWTNEVFKITGKYPGLWSGDFLYQSDNIDNRQAMIDEAMNQWKKGALINIMWHACNPALAEPCDWDSAGVLSRLSDQQWAELTTEGSALNVKWKKEIDKISVYLIYLQKKGVEVIWRPMHEMNQRVFWWGGRPGINGTSKLYRLLHDYMVHVKGLNNLIWVWDLQDFRSLAQDVSVYNPGENYWDLLALDVYDGSGYSTEKYNIISKASEGKPIAIGECERLPTIEQLRSQPRWSFFMGWSELEFSSNTLNEIRAIHGSTEVLTLDKMPGWK